LAVAVWTEQAKVPESIVKTVTIDMVKLK